MKQVDSNYLIEKRHKLPKDFDVSKLVFKELQEDFDELMTALGYEFTYDNLVIVTDYDEKTHTIAFAALG